MTAPATTREQRAWFFYDWANSAYVTTTATVLMAPYLTSVARNAACPGLADQTRCRTTLDVLGLPIDPGSLYAYTATVSTLLSALVLVLVGAVADRSAHPTRLLGGFAWVGALAASAMVAVAGTSWGLGVGLLVVANLCLGASLVVYDSLLVRIAGPDDRDRVSSRGWGFGYLGGGLLLALNFLLDLFHTRLGLDRATSTRISLLSAGLWWGGFTLVPVLGLRGVTGTLATPVERRRGVVRGSVVQLADTFRELRRYPQTLLFLLAYLFFNDGIQTVIGSSSLYGSDELGFPQSTVLGVFLFVQFVAWGGALLLGRVAARVGAWRTVLGSLGAWTFVVLGAYLVPQRQLAVFLVLALAIGIVLGGSQALSRSLYSQLIPRGREAEFFSLYQAMERGTSWFGTLLFGLVHQWTGSYRDALVALVVFFVVGGVLLSRVRMREGIVAAGNPVPRVV
ncbi:MFS transporter [Lapillicoccus jejuensis]|uniref:UMF1 family MFS transporter n=1 Tax=Lapillicoccus jejuensis TaxID=402171 RepID=A0A542E4U7_9MICO|nr:MFS transporter [Lapillicoccus jejuensis]TQJ10360.1 UMF1 family MFS transporter [Lapillicoccus jejuensis]